MVARKNMAVAAGLVLVLCMPVLFLSCERDTGTSAGGSESKSSDPFKTFQEGGTIEFTVQGQPYTVQITDCLYNNTEGDYPDYVEIAGAGTLVHFSNEAKMHDDAQGLSDFATIVGKPLPLWTEVSEAMEITVTGRGKYTISGGALTLERFEHGMEGRDWWEGRIELKLKTEHGDTPVSGTFKTCIVPVW